MAGKSVGNLAIVISGDSGPFARETARAEAEARRFVGSVGKITSGAGGALAKGGGLFGNMAGKAGNFLGMTAAVTAGNLLTGGLTGLAGAAADAAVSGLKLAADYESAGVQFGVLTGSAETAKKLLEDIDKLAIATPFGSADFVQAGRELLGFRVAADDLVPTLAMLSDVASGDLEHFKSMVTQFGQAVSSTQLRKDDFNIFAQAGADVSQFAKAAGTDMKGLFEMFEQGAVTSDVMVRGFKAMTAEGGMFHDMNAKMSRTVKGQWQSLVESADVLKRKVGLAFFEGFKPGELLDQATDRIGEFTGETKDLVGTFADLRKAVDAISPAAIAAFGAMGGAALDAAGKIAPLDMKDVREGSESFGRSAVRVFAEASNGVMLLVSNVGLLQARIDKLTEGGLLRHFLDMAGGKFDLSLLPPHLAARAVGLAKKEDFTIQLGPRLVGGKAGASEADKAVKFWSDMKDKFVDVEGAGNRAVADYDRRLAAERMRAGLPRIDPDVVLRSLNDMADGRADNKETKDVLKQIRGLNDEQKGRLASIDAALRELVELSRGSGAGF